MGSPIIKSLFARMASELVQPQVAWSVYNHKKELLVRLSRHTKEICGNVEKIDFESLVLDQLRKHSLALSLVTTLFH